MLGTYLKFVGTSLPNSNFMSVRAYAVRFFISSHMEYLTLSVGEDNIHEFKKTFKKLHYSVDRSISSIGITNQLVIAQGFMILLNHHM